MKAARLRFRRPLRIRRFLGRSGGASRNSGRFLVFFRLRLANVLLQCNRNRGHGLTRASRNSLRLLRVGAGRIAAVARMLLLLLLLNNSSLDHHLLVAGLLLLPNSRLQNIHARKLVRHGFHQKLLLVQKRRRWWWTRSNKWRCLGSGQRSKSSSGMRRRQSVRWSGQFRCQLARIHVNFSRLSSVRDGRIAAFALLRRMLLQPLGFVDVQAGQKDGLLWFSLEWEKNENVKHNSNFFLQLIIVNLWSPFYFYSWISAHISHRAILRN